MKVTKMNSAKKNSIKTILSRALVVMLSYAMISSTSPAGYVAAYGLDETTDVAAEQTATTEETQATEAAPAETHAPAEEPAQAAPAQTETTIALNLGNGYITYYGQTIAAPTSSLSVPTDRDFTFAAAANGGYTLKAVYRTMGESETPIAANADGTYTLAASDFAAGVGIRIETEGAASEGAAATSLTSAQDALDQVLADSTETVYTYEDQYVSVTATLSDPHAVPDDADFVVTPITKDAKDENGNPVYAYDTYLDALNGGTTTEDSIYTSENTLFYDVAFMYPELGEDGQPTGRTIEFEPANGTVKLDITFKQAQLSDALGVTDDNTSEVTVNHLDINQDVREAEGSTAEATDLSVDDIKVENLTAASDASVSVEESDSATVTLDSLSPLGFTVNTNDGGWTDGQLNYATNSTKNAFTSSEYYNANRSLGIAGNFHIVAFDTATLTTHTNGNVLAHNLIAQSNFGTNQLTDELSYVQNIEQFPNSGLPRTTDVLVVGSGVQVGTQDNLFTLNGTRIDRPHYLIRDKDTSSAPYIDLDEVKTDIENRARAMSQVSDTGVTVDFSDQNNRTITYVAGSGAGYYNMTAAKFNEISNTPLNIKGFTSGSEQAVIINIDCAGATKINTPQQMNVYVDGRVVSRSETGDFSTGKVILNFYNTTEDLTINATNVCGQIIAPNANLSVANGNGNFIARNITIKGETHRADFTGTTTPFRASVSGVKTVDGNAPTESFTFDSYALVNGNWEKDETVTSNATTGSFSFSEKTYEAEGTYWYAISENQSGVSGYNLATDLYLVKVEIQKQSSGDSTAYTLKSVTYYKAKQGVTSSNADGTVDIAAIVGAVNENKIEQLSSGATFKADQIKFNNTTVRNGSLTINKTSIGHETPDDATFTITSPDGYSTTIKYSDFKKGSYTLTGLPAGTYTVTENATGAQVAGYNLEMGNGGVVTTEVTLGNESKVTLTNTYTEKETSASFGGTKTMDGQTLTGAAGEYQFQAVEVNAQHQSLGTNAWTATAQLDKDGKFSFNVSYGWDQRGTTHYYKVTEVAHEGTTDGIIYDKTAHYVKVEVPADLSKPTVTYEDDEIIFANQHAGQLTIKKSFEGAQLSANQVADIKFTVTGPDGYSKTFTYDQMKNGSKTLENLRPGTYKVTESNAHVDGYVVTTTYSVGDNGTVEVTPKDTAEVTVTNTYTQTGFSVYKTVDGATPTESQTFTFQLEEYNEAFATAMGSDFITAQSNRGEARFTLDGISEGTHYYKLTEQAADDATYAPNKTTYYVKVVSTSEGATATVYTDQAMTQEVSGEQVAFTNATINHLGVVKSVEGRDAKQGEQYTFTMTASEKNPVGATITNDTVIATANKKGEFKTNGTFGVSFTQEGTYTFTIHEERPATAGTDGMVYAADRTVTYEVTRDNATGALIATAKEGKTALGQNPSVTMVNKQTTTSANLSAHKSYNRTLQGNDFSFTLTAQDNAPMPAGAKNSTLTVKNNSDGKIDFGSISYDHAGTYKYTIAEVIPEGANEANNYMLNGVKYDATPRTVTVTVTANEETGALENSVTYGDSTKAPVFTNTYTAEGTTASLSAHKTYNRDLKGNDFSFTLTAGTNTAGEGVATPMPEGAANGALTVKNDSDGKIDFGSISYDHAGTYTYTISEVIPKDAKDNKLAGISYDETVYTATVTVKDDGNGKLYVDGNPVYSVGSTTAKKAEFTNAYTAEGTSANLSAHKTYTGDGVTLKGEDFSFTLTAGTNTAGEGVTTPMPEGAANGTLTIGNAANGNVDFGSISYDKAGTYTYTISEVIPEGAKDNKLAGISYDPTVYTATVTVKDDGNGKLYVDGDPVYTAEGKEAAQTAEFTNSYEATGQIALVAQKVLNGTTSARTLGNEEFSFELYETGSNFEVAKNAEPLQTVKNNGEQISFKSITYKKAGTHYYVIREALPDGATAENGYTVNHITYDHTQHNVTVTVTDDDNAGKLTAVADYNGSEEGSLTITNTYHTEGDAVIKAAKKFNGPADHEFTFELTDADGNRIDTKTVKAGETASFEARHFTAEATATYYVREVVPEGATAANNYTYEGITYDPTPHKVTVKMTDNGQGELVPTIKYDENEDPLTITNTYATSGTAQIQVKKVFEKNGSTVRDATFTFVLKDADGKVIQRKSVKGSGTVAFDEISYNRADTYTYTVEEVLPEGATAENNYTVNGITYDPNPHTVTVKMTDNKTGGLVPTVTYDGNKSPLAVTNTYSTTSTTAQIEGTKFMTGRDFQGQNILNIPLFHVGDEFTFDIAAKDNAPLPAQTSVTVNPITDNGNSFDFAFGEITYTKAGTYKYIVTERVPSDAVDSVKNGVEYDTTKHEVTVNVVDNHDGTLSATVDYNGKVEGAGTLSITNSYSAKGEYILTGTKSIDTRDVEEGDTFHYVVKEGEKVVARGTSDGTGTISFDPIHYTMQDLGDHDYVVSEEVVNSKGVTSTAQTFTVTVNVADKGDGTLTVTPKEGNPTVAFVNTYEASGNVTFSGTKTYKDAEGHTLAMPTGNKAFTFKMVEVNQNGDVVKTQDNWNSIPLNQNGSIAFPTITYNLKSEDGEVKSDLGTHYYQVTENMPEGANAENNYTVDGITYDPTVYTYTVTVSDKAEGKKDGNLIVTTTASKGDREVNDKTETGVPVVTFANTYAANGSITFSGTKTVTNKSDSDKKFEFNLVETDQEWNALQGGVSQTKTTKGEGNINFDPIAYDKAGTHYYKVTETVGNATGYTYDTTEYHVTVVVTDNGNGQLVNTVTIVKGDDTLVYQGTGEDAQAISGLNFTNTYQALATDTTLYAVKNLTGRDWKTGENGDTADVFTFQLSASEGAPMPTDGTYTATATAENHNATFGSIHYTQAGTYEYSISELAPTGEGVVDHKDGTYTLNGVTYDTNAVAYVTVTVRDVDGKLKATAEYQATTLDEDNKPVFTNTYQASKTTATLGAAKELNGGVIADFNGKFSFTLTAGENNANVATPMPTAAGDADTLTVANAGAAVSFGDIEYAKAGTYNYTITEVQGDQGGVTYDEHEHTAKVVVADDNNGALHATVTYDDVAATDDAPSPAPVFTNTYFAAKANISADKHYFGAGNGAFDFTLVKTDADWNAIDDGTGTFANYGAGDTVVDEGQPFQITVSNGAYENGVAKVEFPEITYYEAGTYYYKLAETSEDATDASIYLVTVTVDENQRATVAYQAVRDSQELSEATPTDAPAFYNNGYVAAAGRAMRMRAMRNAEHSVNVMPVVQKELDGATLEEGQFTFELADSNGKVVATATNDADGTVAFAQKTADGVDITSKGNATITNGVLNFTKPGTYTYTITEVAGEDQLIKYDGSEIMLTVTVKADAKGKLTATTSYEGATKTTDDGTPIFVNKQKTVVLRTQKTSKVTGEPLPGSTYGLWMANEGGEDVYLGNDVSDENGYIEFADFQPEEGKKYYFKEEAAPAGHLVDPYRSVYMIFKRTNKGYEILYEGTSEYEEFIASEAKGE